MLKSNLVKALCLTSLLVLPISSAVAVEEEPIYGSQLMTQQELQSHRQKMQAAKTPEERARIRQENHEKMRLRAEEKGIDFPDNPPTEPDQMNQQNRPGSGMGPGTGSGMGSGKGPDKAPGTSSGMGQGMGSDRSMPIYGSQLMTQQERQLQRQKLQAAKTPEERARIRQENHEKMRLRAKEKGIDLPDNPPAEPGQMNQQDRPASGMGSGMGSGGNR